MQSSLLTKSLGHKFRSEYDILDEFDFYKHDHSLSDFFNWCKRWQGFAFSPNQRIIVTNVDTDYYPNALNCQYTKATLGDNNYNFFACCSFFQLPTDFFIYISTQAGINQEVSYACELFNLPRPMVVETLNTILTEPSEIETNDFDSSLINYPFICLNNLKRSHRLLFLSLLTEHGLLDKGIVSWQFSTSSNVSPYFQGETPDTVTDFPFTMRSSVPRIRINDQITMSHNHHQILAMHQDQFLRSDRKLHNITNHNSFYTPILKTALAYIVTETVFEYPYPWISEKTIKGILSKRPMIIVGPSGTLAHLRSMGFKTFDKLWDETYDSITKTSDRLDAIIEVVKNISSLNAAARMELSVAAQDIVEFNFTHYVSNFFNTINTKTI